MYDNIAVLKRIGICISVAFSFFLISCSSEDYFTLVGLDSSHYIIAHRGNFAQVDYPENSRASLKSALALDIYGVECDVRQTKDGILIICHDKEFDGLNISETSYLKLCNHLLKNGETLPTLEEYLKIYKNSHSKAKLIIELKSCSVTDVISLVELYALQDSVEFLSFDIDYCDRLVNLGYGSKVYYLDGALSPHEVFERGYAGIDYDVNVLKSNQNWIPEAKSLGLKVGVWIVDDLYLLKSFVENKVIVTTNKAWLCARTIN